MANNETFEDLMDSINNIAQGLGFQNGIDWASNAQKAGEIEYFVYKEYEHCHKLRVRFSHGGARDINVSDETLNKTRNYLRDIQRTKIRGTVVYKAERSHKKHVEKGKLTKCDFCEFYDGEKCTNYGYYFMGQRIYSANPNGYMIEKRKLECPRDAIERFIKSKK